MSLICGQAVAAFKEYNYKTKNNDYMLWEEEIKKS